MGNAMCIGGYQMAKKLGIPTVTLYKYLRHRGDEARGKQGPEAQANAYLSDHLPF